MNIKRVCHYRGRNYNILPAILVTPKEDGFIVALKWWNFHFGVYFQKKWPDITEQPHPNDVMYCWTPDDEIV